MKRVLMLSNLAVALLSAGCATSPDNQRPQVDTVNVAYAPRSAAALAFDPPVALAAPVAPLDRAGRATEAFAGYEQQVTSYSYVHQRDEVRHYSDYGNLERAAYTDRVSVTTR